VNPHRIAERRRQRDKVERKPMPEGQKHRNVGGNERGQDGGFSRISSMDCVHAQDDKDGLGQNTCSRLRALGLAIPRP
jgi:hypothetical protein